MVNDKPKLNKGYPHKHHNMLSKLLSLLTLCLLSQLSLANTSLSASVDRNKVYLNESFNLKLQGNVDIDFSLGGLMSFGRNQIEAPTIKGLEDSFEILDRQQNYSMRSINGDTTTEVTWNYTLSPKQAGTLTIPQAILQGAKSEAIVIEVVEGKAPIDADNPPPVFIEVETDKSDVYVQEQIQYTVRLFSLGRLSSGNLSEPATSNAIIEPFGEENKYYRMAYNQRYEVIERKYLIYPQKSGALYIDGLAFNGVLIDSYQRRRIRVSEISDAVQVNIAQPNPNFTGQHWLPAKSLHLSEKWQDEQLELSIGDAFTHEITTSALGLLGSALPPIPAVSNERVKSYPDKPSVESQAHEGGSYAIRKDATTYIAIKQGEITLPEIRIPWWDTVNDVERIATLPERTIIIKPGAVNQTQKNEQPSSIDLTDDGKATPNKEPEIESTAKNTEPKHNESNQHALLAIIALLAFGWLLTSLFLLLRLKQVKQDLNKLISIQAPDSTTSELSYKQLIEAIRKGSSDIPKLVLAWIESQRKQNTVKSAPITLRSLKALDESLAAELLAFENDRYSKNATQTYDQQALLEALKKYTKTAPGLKGKDNASLPPFYPQ